MTGGALLFGHGTAEMPVTLMLAGALVPAEVARESAGEMQDGMLAQRLRRASLVSSNVGDLTRDDAATADEVWLAREVFGGSLPLPTAPYALAELGGDRAGRDQVWHVDPVHLAVGIDSVVVQPLDATPPDPGELAALFEAAADAFEGVGFKTDRVGERWFLRTARRWSLGVPSLAAVANRPLRIPRGAEDALLLGRLHNAIQMSWFEHPVNLRRESHGLPTINGVWLHGGGVFAPLHPLRWSQLLSERAELRGAARAAGATTDHADQAPAADALIVWDDAAAPARSGDWTGWSRAMQSIERRFAALPAASVAEIVLTGQRCIKHASVRGRDRFRVWSARTFAEACTE